jgi:hypothetical protein
MTGEQARVVHNFIVQHEAPSGDLQYRVKKNRKRSPGRFCSPRQGWAYARAGGGRVVQRRGGIFIDNSLSHCVRICYII